eukprot:gene3633-4524_t
MIKQHYSSTTTTTTTGSLKKPFIVLGIETSCDDTCVGIISSDKKILGDYSKPQWSIHKENGGIHPKLASNAHTEVMDQAVDTALKESKLTMDDVDVVAVTSGPGIALSLQVGLEKAKSLARQFNKPFCAVNHMEGHSLIVRLLEEVEFPYLTLLVSGGHTQMLVCRGVSNYTQIGNTLDDAVGEALDKAARALGCSFGELDDGFTVHKNIHGGQAIEILAQRGDKSVFNFKIPMTHSANCDFSFSGLKTTFQNAVDACKLESGTGELTLRDKYDLAASFQYVIFEHIINKLTKALDWYQFNQNGSNRPDRPTMVSPSGKKIKTKSLIDSRHLMEFPPLKGFVVSGGVAKNKYLRSKLEQVAASYQIPIHFPDPSLCNDNGVMIAWAGAEMYNLGMTSDPDKTIYIPIWPLDKNPLPIFKSNLKEKDQELRKNWYSNIVERFGSTNEPKHR